MARGGYRPGAGRPPGAKNKKPENTKVVNIKKNLSPLEYLLGVMRNKNSLIERRIQAAVAALPFCHAKPALGKKEQRRQAADEAGIDWLSPELAKIFREGISPLEYLLKVMRNESEDIRYRMQASVAAAPYVHRKAGALGKKEERRVKANQAATGKFSPGVPPLKVVPERQ